MKTSILYNQSCQHLIYSTCCCIIYFVYIYTLSKHFSFWFPCCFICLLAQWLYRVAHFAKINNNMHLRMTKRQAVHRKIFWLYFSNSKQNAFVLKISLEVIDDFFIGRINFQNMDENSNKNETAWQKLAFLLLNLLAFLWLFNKSNCVQVDLLLVANYVQCTSIYHAASEPL